MSGPFDGWAVGDGGNAWRLSGGVWRPVYSPTTGYLKSIALAGPAMAGLWVVTTTATVR